MQVKRGDGGETGTSAEGQRLQGHKDLISEGSGFIE